VLAAGKKFSGILIEGEGRSVVVGIGVNCTHHPGQAAFPATDLAAAGVLVTAEALFSQLSGTMARRIGQWNRGAGFEAIRADWLARASGIGEPIRVALPDGERCGRFETLDGRGRLVLRLAGGGRETITAGDVASFVSGRRVARAESE
jgi:BirA family biotin operon repressor/biotin-[acetyl-CoA-carboxylase] ligase